MATERPPADAPPALFTFLEQRAVGELGAFVAATPMLRLVGRGDRHPVLVIPGFTASDRSTEVLRWYLRSLGYWTHGWQQGRNYGPNGRTIAGMIARLTELHDRHGRTVSLVGQSLGGVYARHLALRYPGMVRSVITLGSPFRSQPGDRSAVEQLWRMTSARSRPQLRRLIVDEEDLVLSVPSTAIYSRTDGIVAWQLCIESAGPLRESIEVRSSHSGMAVHPSALYAVADRLAQPEGHWRPFRPPPGLRHLYPTPATYRPAPAA
jgi:pimeloyl-ACP methyl ester carboxylesterase